ncbi:MAG: sulfate adenylyltransferase subunit CysN [Victivallaceae bacterium]|nr:sulfate adenylyltransferase subunit CysN [Victivallaceae bacterium]
MGKAAECGYVVREENEIRRNLAAYLRRQETRDRLRFLAAGSVDDGKSTLIGRLLYDCRAIYEDQLGAVMQAGQLYGTTGGGFDPALLTDGLKAEREQGITIDVAYRYFSTAKRNFIICDAPGHEQYTRNMATGASRCSLAVILIDAANGVRPQTRRHSFICSLLGIRHFIIAVNKMDKVGYGERVFRAIKRDYENFAAKLTVHDISFIPISALKGDNVVDGSANMPWFRGAPLLAALEEISIGSDMNLIDFRLPVQYVLRRNADFRGFAGTVASGVLRRGDEIISLPSGRKTAINSLTVAGEECREAFASQAVVVTTADEIDISRGCMLARPDNLPTVDNFFDANLVWMGTSPGISGKNFILRLSSQTVPAEISRIRYRFEVNSLHRRKAGELMLNDIGRVEITAHRPVCFDCYSRNKPTGSFILIDPSTNGTVAAGMIIASSAETHFDRTAGKDPVSANISWEKSAVTAAARRQLFGHKPVTVWLTGLSGSGKSTLAQALELELTGRGIKAFILDGDNIRHGLNKDLGFSEADRTENIRRVAEVAKLMNSAGLLVIAAFISPFRKDRKHAEQIIGRDKFIEVYVKAGIAVCRQRDPKGLYGKAAAGKITGFTGIDSPYEVPVSPDIELDTEKNRAEDCVAQIMKYLGSLR